MRITVSLHFYAFSKQNTFTSGFVGADPTAEKPKVNNEGKVFNDTTPSVFRENYPRLQQIKKKYDPDLLFSKWFVVTPA